ncbi:MAG: hypothetical protein K0R39_1577 [Symbiobacteriaceae bacterium]|jgi:hypothetical protein|nr:hypothetical protein [Symbiobacteriaceae bacterium]
MPDPTWVRVTFRDAGDETLLVMEPVLPPADPLQREPDTYPLKWSAHRAPIVRRLKLLFEAAQFELRPDVWYQMPTEVGEDEGGAVVFGSWTNASLLPRESEGDEEAAAGEQGQG